MMRTCTIEGCEKPRSGRGWCHVHYMRWYTTGDPGEASLRRDPAPAEVRLMSRYTVSPNGCWEWTGQRSPTGYGVISVGGDGRRAHRIAYELWVGEIPDGREIDHLCRNRGCINPDHLEAVTHDENMARAQPFHYNSAKQECPQGHLYDAENTLWQETPGRRPYRICRECNRIAAREYQRRRRQQVA